MTDLVVLATGFGAIPLAAILLYAVAGIVMRHREASWGFLAGVVAFLGVSHAMAAVLFYHTLFGDPVLATSLASVGLVVGAGIAWLILEGPFIQKGMNRILGAAVVFLALHSFGDGLVLGAAFIGGVPPTVRIDGATLTATVIHRFVEGSLVIIPALAASWKRTPAFVALLASLFAIPAAYVPNWIFNAVSQPLRADAELAVPTFIAAVEGTLGLWLLVRAFLPMAAADRGSRWPVWTAIGFILISIVHFFVE
jgi:zinc transporter ZupT